MTIKNLILIACTVLASADRAMAFTIGTQNLYHYTTRLSERIQHMKDDLKVTPPPDIVGFQEAARWVHREHLFDTFTGATGYTGVYKNTNDYVILNDGVGLVSHLNSQFLDSVDLPNTKAFSNQAFNVGIFITAEGDKVVVINAHLSPSAEGEPRRYAQIQFILQYVERFKSFPIVIMGDLNAPYDARSNQLLVSAGYVDVLGGQGATYVPGENPLVDDNRFGPTRLDYIFYQPAKLRVKSADLMFRQNWVSDHYGLRAEFEVVK